jgi:hypothetical protein
MQDSRIGRVNVLNITNTKYIVCDVTSIDTVWESSAFLCLCCCGCNKQQKGGHGFDLP